MTVEVSRAGQPSFTSADVTPTVVDLILEDAYRLDAREYDAWLDLWAPDDDIRYSVPIQVEPGARPHVSIVADDRRRLHERVARLLSGTAYGQKPPSLTARVVGGIQVASGGPGRQLVRASFVLIESRAGSQQMYGGNYRYEIGEGSIPKIYSKTVSLHNSREYLGNLSFIF